MAEKKDHNREQNEAMENKAAQKLAEALGEDIGEIPEVSITAEELKKLEQADRKKRNRKRASIVGIAAALILVCGVAAYAAWPKIAVPVDADKNNEQSVEEENGVVVINENGAEGESAVTRTEKNWDKVADVRKDFPELVIPSYVPEGYEFVELKIEQYENMGYRAIYEFQKKDYTLRIEDSTYQEQGENAPILTGKERTVDTKKGKGYILDEKNGHVYMLMLTLDQGGKTLCVSSHSGAISEEEYIKIVNEIDMP